MDLSVIKTEMRKMAKASFHESNIPVSDQELIDDIRIFFNLIMTNAGYQLLDGISSEMPLDLQYLLVDGRGKLANLKSVASLFDAFAKKVILMTGLDSYNGVKNKTMMPLYKEIVQNQNLPVILESSVETFKGDPSGLYIFGTAYLTRNEIHNSPDWDMYEIYRRTRYVVSLYVLVVFKLKSQLLSIHPELNTDKLYEYGDTKESQTAYDFISYSKPSNKIKNQVLNSFISHTLYNECPMPIKDLVVKVLDFAQGTISEDAAQRIIQNLISKKVLLFDKDKTKILISDTERDRVSTLISDYNDSLSLFHSAVDKIILENSVNLDKDLLIQKLGVFLESNFNLDAKEISNEESEKTTFTYYQEFINFIKAGGANEEQAELIFNELIDACRNNDIIIRISIGKVFSKISNPDQFGNYVKSMPHDVYLDTQIILYMMCINDDYLAYDNVFYRVAKNIIDLSRKNKNFVLKVSDHYLSEVAYQLKQALFLIQFTEISNMPDVPISTNVFYKYYYWLHKNNGLPEGVDTYRDFMDDMFELREEDAFSRDYESIGLGAVESILKENFNISIDHTSQYDTSKLSLVQELYEKVIKKNCCENKVYKILKNDALECIVLFSQPFDKPEPFFLTWDRSFSYMRPAYKQKFKRGSASLFFHLFSPAKFVNHVDLVNFHVDASTLSDDLLSMIESHNYKETTYNVIDSINKFLDIPDITPEKRASYIKKVQKEIYNEEFFSYEPLDLEMADTTNKRSFSYISQELFNYFKDKGAGYTKNYRDTLLDEASFESVLNVINEYLKSDDINFNISNTISKVSNIVDTYVKAKREKKSFID